MAERIKVEPSIGVMLDSGAYSAWYHGAPIELADYIDYIKSYGHLFKSIVALDVIPGANRKAAKTQGAIEQAANQSHDNFAKMRKAGINAIPVFHQGEDWKWLERMIDDGVDYIGISPQPRVSQEIILRWLDQCFTRLTDPSGRPLVKTHGFGATSHGLIRRYPWFTVDSTTWALAAGYGTIIVPPFTNRKPDYHRPPLRFSITDRDTAGSRPLLKISPLERGIIDGYLASMGLTLSDIRASDRNRAHVNVAYYMALEATLVRESFLSPAAMPAGFKRRKLTSRAFDWRPAVIFAEQMGKTDYGRVLAKCGANERLISYYECRKYDTSVPIETYTRTGLWESPTRKASKRRWGTSYIVRRRLGLLARLQEEDPNA